MNAHGKLVDWQGQQVRAVDLCSGVDGTLDFVRDGAGKLLRWTVDGETREPNRFDYAMFVSVRKVQIRHALRLAAEAREQAYWDARLGIKR